MNVLSVEISKTQKRLNVLDFSWFRPVLYDFDLSRIHLKSVGSDHMTEIINRFHMKTTLFTVSIQTMFSEAFKHFGNMSVMFVLVTRKDQDIVQIYNNINIKNVIKNTIQESLKAALRIRQQIHDKYWVLVPSQD